MASKACASSAELWVTMSAAAQRLLDNHWSNEAVSCFEKACAHFAGASDINDADLEVLDKAVKTFRVRFTRGSPTEHVQASVAAAFGAIERALRVLPEDRVSFGDKIGGLGRELVMLASSVGSRAEQDSVVAAASTWKPTHDAMSAWHGFGDNRRCARQDGRAAWVPDLVRILASDRRGQREARRVRRFARVGVRRHHHEMGQAAP
jgi:hypothetical protein